MQMLMDQEHSKMALGSVLFSSRLLNWFGVLEGGLLGDNLLPFGW